MRHGHNSITVKAGAGYNITFDVDVKTAMARKDARIKRLFGIIVEMSDESTGLKSIIRELTGDWVNDPLAYYQKLQQESEGEDEDEDG